MGSKLSGTSGKVVTSTNTTITGASGTTTITVTFSSHSFVVGDRILIESVGGMTDLNGEHTVATIAAGTDLTVVIPETAQSYTSGGTAKTCASITSWTLDEAGEVIKTSDSSVATPFWDTYISAGFKGATGTFDTYFITGTSDIVVIGSSMVLILRLNSTNYYTCTAFITGNSSTVDVPGTEAIKKTYTFTTTTTITPTVA
jgi:hypothetical protein